MPELSAVTTPATPDRRAILQERLLQGTREMDFIAFLGRHEEWGMGNGSYGSHGPFLTIPDLPTPLKT